VAAIATYLSQVAIEAKSRGYNFDIAKLTPKRIRKKVHVTSGQLEFERDHLLRKLWRRDRRHYRYLKEASSLAAHPIFGIFSGDVERWEVV
jgi:hypothetical protein